MKEIKFKVWHKIEKRLFDVYGFDKDNVYVDSMNDYLETVVSRKYCDLIQYTGLQDVSGKEIYDGDICKIESEDGKTRISQVIFENGCFNLQFNLLKNGLSHFTENYSLYVIGNIYENPELLEQGRGE